MISCELLKLEVHGRGSTFPFKDTVKSLIVVDNYEIYFSLLKWAL